MDKLAARERLDKTDSAESLNQTVSSGSEERDSGRVHQVIISRRRSTSAADETKRSADGSGDSTGKESSGTLLNFLASLPSSFPNELRLQCIALFGSLPFHSNPW